MTQTNTARLPAARSGSHTVLEDYRALGSLRAHDMVVYEIPTPIDTLNATADHFWAHSRLHDVTATVSSPQPLFNWAGQIGALPAVFGGENTSLRLRLIFSGHGGSETPPANYTAAHFLERFLHSDMHHASTIVQRSLRPSRIATVRAFAGSSHPGLRARVDRTKRLLDRIRSFADLPEGWAGDGSIPACPAAVELALLIVRGLPTGTELPQATASAEGEIGLTWVNDDERFDALIQPDRCIVWMTSDADRSQTGKLLDLTAGGRLDELYAAVSEFFRHANAASAVSG